MKSVFVILGQLETEQEELKGLWLNIFGRWFASREQAEQHAQQFGSFYRHCNIVELKQYHPTEAECLELKSLRKD